MGILEPLKTVLVNVIGVESLEEVAVKKKKLKMVVVILTVIQVKAMVLETSNLVGKETVSKILEVAIVEAALLQWLGRKTCWGSAFRMRSRRSFLRLCLVADVSQWLGHVFIVFMGHDFIVFRGSKSNVSRFLRFHSCNGLDAKPAGALPFRMRSRRSFLGLCLVAAVSQWLGHLFLRLHPPKKI